MKRFLLSLCLSLPLFAQAAEYRSIAKIWVITTTESVQTGTERHMMILADRSILPQGGEHPGCGSDHRRMYIDKADKAMQATALGAALGNKVIGFIYDDAAPVAYIAGHEAALTCRVKSIWVGPQ